MQGTKQVEKMKRTKPSNYDQEEIVRRKKLNKPRRKEKFNGQD
jgi:hypothetical protein